MKTYCPRCGRSVPPGHRCGKKPDKRGARLDSEPWRSEYGTAKYRAERQKVIERQHGRCATCGTVCAVKEGGKWVSRGGDVHHVDKLRAGGASDAGSMVLLCRKCHLKADRPR